MYLNEIFGIFFTFNYKEVLPDGQSQGGQSNIAPVNPDSLLVLPFHETQDLRPDVDVLNVSSDLGEVEVLHVEQQSSELNTAHTVVQFQLVLKSVHCSSISQREL